MNSGSAASEEVENPSRRDWFSLGAVLVVQTQNAFNDNLVKFVRIGFGRAAQVRLIR